MPVRPTDTPPVGKVYFKQTGRFVRAPASDSLRRPKGSAVFIPVDENNRRTDVDASMDPPDGPTGSLSPDWKMVYIPPYFRVRVAMVVLGIWIFAAITGVFATVGPLLLGRVVLRHAIPQQVAVNDIYAFSVGIYIFGGLAIVLAKASVAKAWIQDTVVHLLAAANKSRTQAASNALKIGALRAAKLAYLAVTVGVIIPALIALVIEFYLVIPVHTIFLPSFLVSPYPYPGSSAYDESLPPTSTGGPADASPVPSSAMVNTTRPPLPTPSPYPFPSQYHSPHTLHFVQDWTLGVLYLKMLFRLMLLNENSTPARTLRRVFPDDDYFNPDIVLATRVLIAPIMGGMLAALLIPFGMARGIVAILGLENMDAGSEVAGMGLSVDEMKVLIYRLAFPGLMAIMAVGGCAWIGLKVVEKWRGMVRDEVYLRGVRVHNHGERLKAPVAEGELINAPQVVAEVDDAVLNAAAVRGNGDRARL